MRLEHHLVGGYVRYISPYIIIIIIPVIFLKLHGEVYSPQATIGLSEALSNTKINLSPRRYPCILLLGGEKQLQ